MASNITVHGLLLWASMGLLMPVGILTIRMSSKKETGSKEAKVFFYLHIVLQVLSVLHSSSLLQTARINSFLLETKSNPSLDSQEVII